MGEHKVSSMPFVPSDACPGRVWAWTGGALVFYVALALVITWPLVTVLGSRVPHDLGDPLLSAWNLWWNGQRLPFSAAWWDAPQFYPAPGTVAFSDHRVGISVISQPLQWLGMSPLLTYNVALLASFALSAIAAHLLVLMLTGRTDAAIISGLAFGFNPYRIAHIEHLELVSSYWMPIVLIALHQYVRRPTPRWVALFCVAWLLQSLCSSYYLFFFSVFVGLWILWFLPTVGWKHGATLLVAWVAAGLLLAPVLLNYQQIHEAHGLVRTLTEVEHFSADITAVLSASPLLAVWRSSPRLLRPEGQLFPGAFAIALVIACLIASRAAEPRQRSWWRRVPLFLSVIFTVVAATARWIAPWRWSFAGVTVSVSSPQKPLSVAVACLVLYCALHPRVRSAFQQKSPFAFYVIAGFVSWVLTWGPAPKLLGYPVLYQAPYAWLMHLPGFSSGLRVPARFAMPAVLALAVAAGLAFARLVPIGTRRLVQTVCFFLIAGGIVADGWISGLPLPAPPRAWTSPLSSSEFDAVLELPLDGGNDLDAAALYRSMFHLHPTLNGFSGHFPVYYDVMHRGLESRDPRLLATIASWGRILIAIDHRNDPDQDWAKYVSSYEGVVRLGTSETWSFFLLPAATGEPPIAITGRELLPQRISSNFSSALTLFLLDNDPYTRWTTRGPQRGDEQVIVDLGAPKELSGVALSLGGYALDFPRHLVIDTSPDGERWTTEWSGTTAGLSVAAALSDPSHVKLEFHFNSPTARFVRVRQTHTALSYGWSIAKLAVFGTAL